MMKLITLSLLLASLVAAAFGEADLKASDAVKFAVAQAKTIKPSAVLVKNRGITKPVSVLVTNFTLNPVYALYIRK